MSKKNARKLSSNLSTRHSPASGWKIWAGRGFAISGWMVAVFLGFLELPEKINKFFEQAPTAMKNVGDAFNRDTRFTGTWTSDWETDITAPLEYLDKSRFEGEPVVLRIDAYAGKVTGEINSAGLGKRWVFSRLILDGIITGGVMHGVVVDIVDRKPMALARFDLTPAVGAEGPELRLSAVEQPVPFLPMEAHFRRDETAMPADLGNLNLEILKSAVAKARQSRTSE
jgi:hypothetical protein